MFKKVKKINIILISVMSICIILLNTMIGIKYSLALSKYGSRGEEVKTIQTKLKRWGYYTGNIDGIYGTQTVNAVKWFQKKNGLTADGIAGNNTLNIYRASCNCSGSIK